MKSSNPGGKVGPDKDDDDVEIEFFGLSSGPNLFEIGIGLFEGDCLVRSMVEVSGGRFGCVGLWADDVMFLLVNDWLGDKRYFFVRDNEEVDCVQSIGNDGGSVS